MRFSSVELDRRKSVAGKYKGREGLKLRIRAVNHSG